MSIILIVVILLLVILLVLGVPAALAMGLPALLYFFVKEIPLSTVMYSMYNQLNSFSLISVPMFILMGNLVNELGYTDDLFYFLKRVMRNKRGYSARLNVFISLIFSGISGVAIADIGGLGKMEVKAMEDEGYPRGYASALTIATATIGPVFPPSVPLLLFAMMAEVSSVRSLIAGVVPGIVMSIILLLGVMVLDKKYLASRPAKDSLGNIPPMQAFWGSFPTLIAAPSIVLLMMFGVFSPSETGALTVLFFLIAGLIQRRLNFQKILKCLKITFTVCASTLFVTAAGGVFSKVMVLENLPNVIITALFTVTESKVIILLLINLILLILGCFMTSTSALVLSIPIILPVTNALGIDPIHVGVIMTLNLMIGLITPPFGLSVFTVARIVDIPPEKVFKASVPLLIELLIALMFITFIPQLSLWLPNLMFGI